MMATIPSPGDGSNLVSNGGFEVTAPRNTSNSEFQIWPGQPDICYWSVGGWHQTTNKVNLKGIEGSNSLLLGDADNIGAAMITQLIRTRPGNNYSLSFFLAGSSDCDDPMKTMTVQLSPSTNASQFMVNTQFQFHSQGNGVSWDLISLNFTALSEATNLTFINGMSRKSCAPLIDKVTVIHGQYMVSQAQGRDSGHENNYAGRNKISVSTIVAVIIVICSVTVIAGLTAALSIFFPTKRAALINILKKTRRKRSNIELASGQKKPMENDMPYEYALDNISTYTMQELAKATDNFTTKVGEGGFGTVYRACLADKRIGAVKRATRSRKQDPAVFNEELSVLLRVRHPYLVNLIGLCFERGEHILVFEFIPKGSLYDRLHTEKGYAAGPLSWADRMNIAFQVAVALEYLHEEAKPTIVHRDIKSSNVLLVEDNQAKLADFGLSRLGPKENQATFTAVKGSYGYTDPQYIKTAKLSVKSDVYSFGVLLVELITGLKSVQGMLTLSESTEPNRLSEDINIVAKMVDPKLHGQIDLKELENTVKIANLCVLEKRELRPCMRQIVSAMRSRRCIFPVPPKWSDDGSNTDASTSSSSYERGVLEDKSSNSYGGRSISTSL